MSIDNENLITSIKIVEDSCSDNCKIYNKATVSYDYIVDNEINTSYSEYQTVSTCIQQNL